MKTRTRIVWGVALAIAIAGCSQDPVQPSAEVNKTEAAIPALNYPVTKTVELVETLHGVDIADPYRWLESDIREDSAVASWVAAENAVTLQYLEGLKGRERFSARLSELWNFERYRLPLKRGNRYFNRVNNGLQNQFVLYVRDGLDGEPRAIIDPNTWSDDGTIALAAYEPSPDGSMVLYAKQDGGSDWKTLKVLDVNSGVVLEDTIRQVKFISLFWAENGTGFYYSRFPEPKDGSTFQSLNNNQALYFHTLGTEQTKDIRIYARPDNPNDIMQAEMTDDGHYLVIYVSQGTDPVYEILTLDLTNANASPKVLIKGFENEYSLAGSVGTTLAFRTDRDAPRGRLVAIDVDNPAEENWRELVAQSEHVLTDASLVGDKFVLSWLEDVKSVIRLYDLNGGALGEVTLPGLGSAFGFEGEAGDVETFFAFSSFNYPTTIFRLDVATGKCVPFLKPEMTFEPETVAVDQVFYSSKDGTRIPMFLVSRKDLDMTTPSPTILYGYGGFNWSQTPRFSVSVLTWVDMGGVYAVANLRGGGEYGKKWHDAGKLDNKQNVFDDFVAAAEHLIAEGVTSRKNLTISGASNGGLLVGAVMNQRPDLFAVGLPAVGVMDMLRFNQFTAGRLWVDDYGDPGVAHDFEVLHAYSPYHNIQDGVDYPAILVTTADTDDRVVPGHSFKYTARLQALKTGPMPHLIRIETRAGHGSGKPTDKIIAEKADQWAFAAFHTGLEVE